MAFKHGTNYAYLVKKCKCLQCRAWWAGWQKQYREDRSRRTGEAFSGSRGGWVPGKPCACGCGQTLPAKSPKNYKRGHKPSAPGRLGRPAGAPPGEEAAWVGP